MAVVDLRRLPNPLRVRAPFVKRAARPEVIELALQQARAQRVDGTDSSVRRALIDRLHTDASASL